MDSTTWTPTPLPYLAEGLPFVLPTADEIRESSAIIKQRTGETIAAVTPQIVVKFGVSTTASEGQALLFLEQCVPDIPAPRLYALYHDSQDTFIVMERISGVTLDTLWDQLSDDEKDTTCEDLRRVVDIMRSTAGPDCFSAIGDGPMGHLFFWSPEKAAGITGPFQDESELNTALVLQYRQSREFDNGIDFKAHFYNRSFQAVLQNHRPTFTHSDIQKKNILVIDHGPGTPARLRSSRLALLDWETAGWYPEYWEYFSAFCAIRWHDDWSCKVEQSIKPWPAETALMTLLYRDVWF